MSQYHCPLCPLIFQRRTDVASHLHEEHRSRAAETAVLRSELATATTRLDWERLEQLRSSHISPSVTLLLGTAPGAAMTVLDIARLRQLAERARRRFYTETDRSSIGGVIEERLSAAVSVAESEPPDRGLAVLVNEDHMAVVALPFAPRDRHVVGRGFATRDLEYALRRYPRYRVLVLGHHPRILEGHAREVCAPETPAELSSADPDRLLRDRMEAAGPLPLVVVGDRRSLDRFRHVSSYASAAAFEVPRRRFGRTNIPDVVADALDRVHREQQSLVVDELRHADMQAQIEWGLQAAWRAVRDRTTDRIWVEHDYAVPGRLTAGAEGIGILTDPAAPDDLVDGLLARAARSGIHAHLLDRNTLGRRDPVATHIPVLAKLDFPNLGSLTPA